MTCVRLEGLVINDELKLENFLDEGAPIIVEQNMTRKSKGGVIDEV